jgi:hypothetical protein
MLKNEEPNLSAVNLNGKKGEVKGILDYIIEGRR